jgi:hypothetical protein
VTEFYRAFERQVARYVSFPRRGVGLSICLSFVGEKGVAVEWGWGRFSGVGVVEGSN